jgi:hypothetical protein
MCVVRYESCSLRVLASEACQPVTTLNSRKDFGQKLWYATEFGGPPSRTERTRALWKYCAAIHYPGSSVGKFASNAALTGLIASPGELMKMTASYPIGRCQAPVLIC